MSDTSAPDTGTPDTGTPDTGTPDDRSRELSIRFTTEELVALADDLDVRLGFLGDEPLGRRSRAERDLIRELARRLLEARGVIVLPGAAEHDTAADPYVVRAVRGLLEIAARPALRADLILDHGDRGRLEIFSIPYASVEHVELRAGLHQLTPLATADLLVRLTDRAGLVSRPLVRVEPFELTLGDLRRARRATEGSDAVAALVRAGATERSAQAYGAALARGGTTYAVRIVHHPTPGRTAGGEVAWFDAGEAGLWLAPTVDQPFATLSRGAGDDDGDGVGSDGDDDGLDEAIVSIAPIAAEQVAAFLYRLLPGPGGHGRG